jgi:inner membrane protein
MNFENFLWSTEFWLLIGVLCLIVEVLSVSFFFLFLGIGALITSLAVKLGLADAMWVQFLIFSVVSVGSTIAFRGVALRLFGNNSAGKQDYQGDFVGERAVVSKEITPELPGKVSYRGTDWTAEAKDRSETLALGTNVLIKAVRGMVLVVEAT